MGIGSNLNSVQLVTIRTLVLIPGFRRERKRCNSAKLTLTILHAIARHDCSTAGEHEHYAAWLRDCRWRRLRSAIVAFGEGGIRFRRRTAASRPGDWSCAWPADGKRDKHAGRRTSESVSDRRTGADWHAGVEVEQAGIESRWESVNPTGYSIRAI